MDLKAVLELAAVVVAPVAAYYAAMSFIDKRIESRIKDAGFLRKLAAALHPTVIFDSSESILADQGGMAYIESIEVVPSNNPPFPKQILVRPKKHLAYPPLLTILESDLAEITSARGKKHDWLYSLEFHSIDDQRHQVRFRLEIVL